MKKNVLNMPAGNSLRKKAEKKLARKDSELDSTMAEGDAMRLIHELEVHKVELEMQNEELRLALERAEAATKKITLLYDEAPNGYFTLDKHGMIKDLNLNAACLLASDRNRLINSNFTQFISQDTLDTFTEFYQKIIITNSKQTCEIKLMSQDNPSIFVHLEGVVSEDNGNYLMSAIDITRRHLDEEKLKESQVLLQELIATKDKFFSIIAHDLRGPFSAILGFTSLLKDDVNSKNYEKVDFFTSIIQDSSWRAMNLLKNLFEWARIQTGKIKCNPVDTGILSMVDEVLDLLTDIANQKFITFNREIPESIHFLLDQEMISSVIRNLVGNAIKFTKPGGKVTISARQKPDELMIIVSDNGVGIEKENVGKLFQIAGAKSTKGTQNEEGTGLGLIVSKEFVVLHGGKIWVESVPGKGSSFYFTIPLRVGPK